jgi:hypothetical protein
MNHLDISLTEVKDFAIIAKPFIDPIISTLITPKIKKLEKWLKASNLRNETVDNFFENKFKKYLENAYKNFSSVNILIFPNQQIDIKSIYIPTNLSSHRGGESTIITSHEANELLKEYKNILISDTAGMGKSTLMKWIGLSMIETGVSIPVLIDLKSLKKDWKIIDEIHRQIDDIDNSFDKSIILKFLELGRFTILLDGYDEIQESHFYDVIADLKFFSNKLSNNWFILTSRPVSSLTSFGDFKSFKISDLQEKDAYNLFKKFDIILNRDVSYKLISELSTSHSQAGEFLGNPFLASLLYQTYTYNKNIPTKKPAFYDEVYTALYKHHDLSKDGFERDKKSKLDIIDFRRVLRLLAFNTIKDTKISFTEQELINSLTKVRSILMGIAFNEYNFLEDLYLNVPLFNKEGNTYKWAHRSIQEYFAADHISNSPFKNSLIRKLYDSKSGKYYNVIDFLFDLEPTVVRQEIIKPIFEKYLEYYDNSYLNYKINSKDLDIRKSISFISNIIAYKTKYNSRIKKLYKEYLALDSDANQYTNLGEENEPTALENNKILNAIKDKYFLEIQPPDEYDIVLNICKDSVGFFNTISAEATCEKDGNLYILITYDYDALMLQLLSFRDVTAFDLIVCPADVEVLMSFAVKNIVSEKPYDMINTINSYFNQKRFFNRITNFLLNTAGFHNIENPDLVCVLNYKKTKQKLHEINKNMFANDANEQLDMI